MGLSFLVQGWSADQETEIENIGLLAVRFSTSTNWKKKKTIKTLKGFRFRFFFNPKQWVWSSSGAFPKIKIKNKPKSCRRETETKIGWRNRETGFDYRPSEGSHAWWWSRLELGEGLGLHAGFVPVLSHNGQTTLTLVPWLALGRGLCPSKSIGFVIFYFWSKGIESTWQSYNRDVSASWRVKFLLQMDGRGRGPWRCSATPVETRGRTVRTLWFSLGKVK